MRKLYQIFFLFFLIGCIKKKQENLVKDAILNGQWKVTNFNKGGTDITADFATYKFQFNSNFTVDAINNGILEKTGTWNADVSSQTITSNFANASNPLIFLNGTWQINNSSWTWVEASQTLNGELLNLRLDKQ